jgi:hypothetical protein
MRWPWKRQPHHDAARIEGEPLRDGDMYPFPGHPRWSELVTKAHPTVPPGTDSTALVRGYIRRGYEELSPGEYHWTGRYE